MLPHSLFLSFSLWGTVADLTPRGSMPRSLILLGFCWFLCHVEKGILTPPLSQGLTAGYWLWYPAAGSPCPHHNRAQTHSGLCSWPPGARFPGGKAGKGFLRTRKWYKEGAKRSVHKSQENDPVTQGTWDPRTEASGTLCRRAGQNPSLTPGPPPGRVAGSPQPSR